MKYYMLLDIINYYTVVKEEQDEFFTYCFGADTWNQSAIMTRYEWPDDPLYGKYKEITKDEAERILRDTRKEFDRLYVIAIELAKEKYSKQFDKNGEPYIYHLVAIANRLENTEHKIVGLLHDICEKTDVTPEYLRDLGFTEKIVEAIKVITMIPNECFDSYLVRIRRNTIACKVKIADLSYNIDAIRNTNLTSEDHERIEEYKKALEFLRE